MPTKVLPTACMINRQPAASPPPVVREPEQPEDRHGEGEERRDRAPNQPCRNQR